MNMKDIIKFKVFVESLDSTDRIEAELIRFSNKGVLKVKFDGVRVESNNERNWFHQIRQLDNQLKKKGYKLICNGTSLGVNCYGFCSNMGDGSKAYRYDGYTIPVFEYSLWNKYATEEEQEEFLKFISEKCKPLVKELRKAKEQGKNNEELHKMREEWLRKKGITLENFWKKELWK